MHELQVDQRLSGNARAERIAFIIVDELTADIGRDRIKPRLRSITAERRGRPIIPG